MKTTSVILFVAVAIIGVSSQNENGVAKANNLFSATLYKWLLWAKSSSDNYIVSPFSIVAVLSLTQSGAKGATGEQIRSTLHLPNTSKQVENDFKALLPSLKGTQDYTLETANKIYVKTGYSLKPDYKKIATDDYQSGIDSIDFYPNKEQAAETINEWVESQTENRIQNLISPSILNEATRLILINALYFKANWTSQFLKQATSKQSFYKTKSETVDVDFMHKTAVFGYYESTELNSKFLELTLKGGEASMVVILPNEKQGLNSLEKYMDKLFVKPNFTRQAVAVSLPKFTISTSTGLVDILKAAGIYTAFKAGQADLSGIAGDAGDLFISDVLQKAFVAVNEAGVEAAAATAVVITTTSVILKQKEFNCDHPFIFYIQAKGVVLFFGRVVNPQQ